jgi:ABC-type spermidine/putrescine transport system permease subunit I
MASSSTSGGASSSAVPYVWLLLFFVLPFLILLRMSVTDMGNGVDPFAPLIETVAGLLARAAAVSTTTRPSSAMRRGARDADRGASATRSTWRPTPPR